MPKSGEQDDQTAPSDALASAPITASGQLATTAATRSPFYTPASFNPAAHRATAVFNSFRVKMEFFPVSPVNRIA